jgi:uncharacterized protein (TIGR02996 family)
VTATTDAAEAGFRAAVEADPGDFTARLVYADWLDERDRGMEAAGWRATAACGLVPWYFTGPKCWGWANAAVGGMFHVNESRLVPEDWIARVERNRHVRCACSGDVAVLFTQDDTQVSGGWVILKALVAAFGRLPEGAYPEPFAAMTERQWQAHVVGYARLMGWEHYHTHNSRRCVAGFPDLVFAAPGRPLVFAELKTEAGKVRPEQQAWVSLLRTTPNQAFVWRPRDWDQVVKVLVCVKPVEVAR